MPDSTYLDRMDPRQRIWFFAEYERARKEELTAILLALLLGGFGLHKFYVRRNTAGILYLLFFWTGIPAILGLIDCFFISDQVRAYNAAQATFLASQILATPLPEPVTTSSAVFIRPIPAIPTNQHCTTCGASVDPSAAFCPRCGELRTAIA